MREADDGAEGNGSLTNQETEIFRQRFIEAMDDDFNTPQAIGVLFDLAHEINRAREQGLNITHAKESLSELAAVLGFTLEPPSQPSLLAEPFIELLINVRDELRRNRQWQLADTVRSRLSELDIILEDTPGGTQWKHKTRYGEG